MSLMLLFNALANSRGGPLLTLGPVAVTDSGGGTMYAGFYLYRDGTTDERDQGGYTQVNTLTDWIESAARTASIGDAYEMKFVKSGGSSLVGISDNTYYTLNATRGGYITTTLAAKSYTGIVTVREIANPSNLASASVNLNVG